MTLDLSQIVNVLAAALIVGYVRGVARDVRELTQSQTAHEGRLARLEERTRACQKCNEGTQPPTE